MDTATADSTPILVYRSQGEHQGEGFGNGEFREEKRYNEWYDNVDNTYTRKKVTWIKTTETNKEHIHIHRTTIETITEKEYFKRKLAGTLYGT